MLIPLAAAACGSMPSARPALIVAPTAETRAELERVVAAALNGAPLTLADDALTRDDVLIVERRAPPGSQGAIATGRALELPAHFRLVVRRGRCELIRESDGRSFPLRAAKCEPAEPAR